MASARTSIANGCRSFRTTRTWGGSRGVSARCSTPTPARMRFCCRATASTRGARRSPRPNGTSKSWSSCWKSSGGRRLLMARVTIPELNRTIEDAGEIAAFLGAHGVDYERAEPGTPVAADAPAEALLSAYKTKIDELNAQGGYVTADVID